MEKLHLEYNKQLSKQSKSSNIFNMYHDYCLFTIKSTNHTRINYLTQKILHECNFCVWDNARDTTLYARANLYA